MRRKRKLSLLDFNQKYKSYIKKGFYGLAISDNEVISFLDKTVLPMLIEHDLNFNFSSIYMDENNKCVFICENYHFDTVKLAQAWITEKVNSTSN